MATTTVSGDSTYTNPVTTPAAPAHSHGDADTPEIAGAGAIAGEWVALFMP
jgi:hypothetical protein